MTENNIIENNQTNGEANVLMKKKIVSKDYTFVFKDNTAERTRFLRK